MHVHNLHTYTVYDLPMRHSQRFGSWRVGYGGRDEERYCIDSTMLFDTPELPRIVVT